MSVTEQLTLIARRPRLVGAVAPLVLLDLLQLVVVEAHALLDTLLHPRGSEKETHDAIVPAVMCVCARMCLIPFILDANLHLSK